MREIVCSGLDGADPLGFLAAVGLLRIVSGRDTGARLHWVQDGPWMAVLTTSKEEVVHLLVDDVERWRRGHGALDFAVDADRKIEDLKHPPEEFRALMREVREDDEAASFVAAYATGVAVDRSGKQSKPTAFHFTAGQQRFLAAVLSVRDAVSEEDFRETLFGPWVGRTEKDLKDTRWKAGSERSRALVSFDPSKEKTTVVVGAVWLAFQGLPLFPTVPNGVRIVTTRFTGRGNDQAFTWPLWSMPLVIDEVRALLQTNELARMKASARGARGISAILRSTVVRSSQGYGNFAPAVPV